MWFDDVGYVELELQRGLAEGLEDRLMRRLLYEVPLWGEKGRREGVEILGVALRAMHSQALGGDCTFRATGARSGSGLSAHRIMPHKRVLQENACLYGKTKCSSHFGFRITKIIRYPRKKNEPHSNLRRPHPSRLAIDAPREKSAVTSACSSDDGLKLAVGTAEGSIGVLDVMTHGYATALRSHKGSVTAAAIDPCREREEFATASEDCTVRWVDIKIARKRGGFFTCLLGG